MYQPKLDLSHGAVPPDEWLGTTAPQPDFIVSRREDGTPASRYVDLIWDLTAYHPHKKPTLLNFVFWDAPDASAEELCITQEFHWLLFLLMWCRPTPLSVTTLNGYVQHLRSLARFATARSLSLSEILSSEIHLGAVRTVLHPASIKTVNILLAFLYSLGRQVVGFEPAVGETLRKMKADVLKYQSALKQHPPLPTRIYSYLLSSLNEELAAFSQVLDYAIAYAIQCFNLKRNCGVSFDLPPLPPGLAAYFQNRAMPFNHRTVISALSDAQFMAKLQIEAFTGMRNEEASTLPFDCLRKEEIDGAWHHIIVGFTTKLNRGRKRPARWVTCREGVEAITIAQRIATGLYDIFEAPQVTELPLFVSTAYLATHTRSYVWSGGKPRIAKQRFFGPQRDRLGPLLCATITDADLRELEHIDPHRAWRTEEKFSCSTAWPLTSHQLRRTLALYAQRSGLVSLPTLKRQLQHITEEMSRYYARGSAFAANFLKDQNGHVGVEWQETQPISSALSYLRHAVYSDETLFGGHVQWLNRNARDPRGEIHVDREATLRRFKRGELAYKETVLGGCTSTTECKSGAFTIFDADCVSGCSNMVGHLSRLERLIAVQERFVGALQLGTVEHTTETNNLEALRAAREQVIDRRKDTV